MKSDGLGASGHTSGTSRNGIDKAVKPGDGADIAKVAKELKTGEKSVSGLKSKTVIKPQRENNDNTEFESLSSKVVGRPARVAATGQKDSGNGRGRRNQEGETAGARPKVLTASLNVQTRAKPLRTGTGKESSCPSAGGPYSRSTNSSLELLISTGCVDGPKESGSAEDRSCDEKPYLSHSPGQTLNNGVVSTGAVKSGPGPVSKVTNGTSNGKSIHDQDANIDSSVIKKVSGKGLSDSAPQTTVKKRGSSNRHTAAQPRTKSAPPTLAQTQGAQGESLYPGKCSVSSRHSEENVMRLRHGAEKQMPKRKSVKQGHTSLQKVNAKLAPMPKSLSQSKKGGTLNSKDAKQKLLPGQVRLQMQASQRPPRPEAASTPKGALHSASDGRNQVLKQRPPASPLSLASESSGAEASQSPLRPQPQRPPGHQEELEPEMPHSSQPDGPRKREAKPKHAGGDPSTTRAHRDPNPGSESSSCRGVGAQKPWIPNPSESVTDPNPVRDSAPASAGQIHSPSGREKQLGRSGAAAKPRGSCATEKAGSPRTPAGAALGCAAEHRASAAPRRPPGACERTPAAAPSGCRAGRASEDRPGAAGPPAAPEGPAAGPGAWAPRRESPESDSGSATTSSDDIKPRSEDYDAGGSQDEGWHGRGASRCGTALCHDFLGRSSSDTSTPEELRAHDGDPGAEARGGGPGGAQAPSAGDGARSRAAWELRAARAGAAADTDQASSSADDTEDDRSEADAGEGRPPASGAPRVQGIVNPAFEDGAEPESREFAAPFRRSVLLSVDECEEVGSDDGDGPAAPAASPSPPDGFARASGPHARTGRPRAPEEPGGAAAQAARGSHGGSVRGSGSVTPGPGSADPASREERCGATGRESGPEGPCPAGRQPFPAGEDASRREPATCRHSTPLDGDAKSQERPCHLELHQREPSSNTPKISSTKPLDSCPSQDGPARGSHATAPETANNAVLAGNIDDCGTLAQACMCDRRPSKTLSPIYEMDVAAALARSEHAEGRVSDSGSEDSEDGQCFARQDWMLLKQLLSEQDANLNVTSSLPEDLSLAQYLIHQTLLLARDSSKPQGPADAWNRWSELSSPLDSSAATTASAPSADCSPQGEWTILELETQH